MPASAPSPLQRPTEPFRGWKHRRRTFSMVRTSRRRGPRHPRRRIYFTTKQKISERLGLRCLGLLHCRGSNRGRIGPQGWAEGRRVPGMSRRVSKLIEFWWGFGPDVLQN